MKKKMVATIAASVALIGASFAATKTEAAGTTCPTTNVYQVKYTATNVQDVEKWVKQYFPFVSFQPVKPVTKQPAAKQPTTAAKQPTAVAKQPTTKPQAPATVKQPAAKPQANTQAPAKTPATAPKTGTQKTTGLNAYEQQVVELTNKERAKYGLPPLQVDLALSKVAREKSRDMAVNNYFSHNSPTYGSPFEMMKKFGISYTAAGENIAKGQRTPQEVVNAWMNSEGHRANILNKNFTHIGVGFEENGYIWTQQFIRK
ncbi:CAP domain-containing protein [Geobacillus sp. C56-T2]|uniref:CAP domain-containing protein n=1 Tax=Geobacillus sp. C56-T2 TaxID=600773 RepID=UPI0011AAB9FA|nr:CAP domain-containing protein [Geobacillus sp. C56-T2]NNV06260.1 sporulation protein [Geobacillus sp. MMMUD3]TWG30277.1 putative YkwD family protein [Geobacillus sp. C56-T2]